MSTKLDTSSVALWRQTISDNFVTLSVGGLGPQFHGTLESTRLGEGITITAVTNSSSTVARTIQGVRADASNDLLLLTPIDGSLMVNQDGLELPLTRGMISIHVAEEPYELVFPESGHVLVFQAPRRLAPASLLTPARRCATTMRRAPVVPVFRAFLEETLTVSSRMTGADAESLRMAAISLALSVLSSGVTEPVATADARALALRAQAYVRAHLSDDDLTPTKIATHLHVSLRYLQLAFEHLDTSPACFIRTERLERATCLLADPRLRDTSISQIAAMVGYDSGSFIRAFRREYGVTPAVHRAQ